MNDVWPIGTDDFETGSSPVTKTDRTALLVNLDGDGTTASDRRSNMYEKADAMTSLKDKGFYEID